VKRMLSKLPDERPSSLKEFLQDFRRLQIFKVPPVGKLAAN
jgi:hypothetical protein